MLKILTMSQLNLVTDADILDLLRLRFDQLDMNVTMFIVEPGDTVEDIEEEIGFPILTNLFEDVSFPDPDFVPFSEALEDHGGCYEMLFLFSDGDDDAIEIFIPKAGVDPLLLAMCSQFAVVLN
ncbi:MAG: hypothetical protein RIR39_902 [Pseudomonadota bacterium]